MLSTISQRKNKVEFDVSIAFKALKGRGELHGCRTRNLVLLDSDLRRADGNEDLSICLTHASCCLARLISSSSRPWQLLRCLPTHAGTTFPEHRLGAISFWQNEAVFFGQTVGGTWMDNRNGIVNDWLNWRPVIATARGTVHG